MAEPVFRLATDDDAEEIIDVVHPILREFGLIPDPAHTDADLYSVDTHYNNAGGAFWVLVDGVVVGTCGLFRVAADEVDLRKMYLRPEWRGQGWGRRMLEEAIGWARANGFRRITLDTHSHLVDAIALYKRAGFAQTDLKHDLEGRCDLAFTMEL